MHLCTTFILLLILLLVLSLSIFQNEKIDIIEMRKIFFRSILMKTKSLNYLIDDSQYGSPHT